MNLNRTGIYLAASILRQPNSSRAGVVGSFVLFCFVFFLILGRFQQSVLGLAVGWCRSLAVRSSS